MVEQRAGEAFLGHIRSFHRRTLLGIQTSIVFGSLVGLVLFPDSMAVVSTTGTAVLLGSVGIFLARRGASEASVCIAALLLVTMPLVMAWHARGLYDSSMLILPVSVVAIGLVARPRTTLATGVAAMAFTLLIALGTARGWIPVQLPADQAALAARDTPVIIVIVAFAVFVGVSMSSALTFLLQALESQHANLEEAVRQRTADLASTNAELETAIERIERTSRELLRSERMATLGSAVAGVTHELATPLGNALVAASSMEDAVAELGSKMQAGTLRRSELVGFVDTSRENVGLVMRALDRARDLVQSFKRVSVDQASGRRRSYMLDECVADLVRTFRASTSTRRLPVDVRVDPGIALEGYPGPLGQIVTNLLQNAAVHGLDGKPDGRIEVIGHRVEDGFELVVADNGDGMDDGLLSRIFEPFFTTRGNHEGSGLGLSISRQLAANVLGGRLTVESRRGEGSRFILRAPLNAPSNGDGTA